MSKNLSRCFQFGILKDDLLNAVRFIDFSKENTIELLQKGFVVEDVDLETNVSTRRDSLSSLSQSLSSGQGSKSLANQLPTAFDAIKSKIGEKFPLRYSFTDRVIDGSISPFESC